MRGSAGVLIKKMTFLDHIHACNNFNSNSYIPFLVENQRYGWVSADFAQKLSAWPELFMISTEHIRLEKSLKTFDSRSQALLDPLNELLRENYVEAWRNEYYPVTLDWHTPAVMKIERAACPYFGIRAYGVHLNGFVRKRDGIHMWVAKRDRNKQTYPGLLDNMVAGGQPIGLGLKENLIKECGEEAGLPVKISSQATSTSFISYTHLMPHMPEGGVKPDQIFCFDIELPHDFDPKPIDGEVESFHLWPIEKVAETVRTTNKFKFNCNLVIIDFLIRHGVITPDEEPDFIAIVQGLRSGI